jgi:hypothetical protein
LLICGDQNGHQDFLYFGSVPSAVASPDFSVDDCRSDACSDSQFVASTAGSRRNVNRSARWFSRCLASLALAACDFTRATSVAWFSVNRTLRTRSPRLVNSPIAKRSRAESDCRTGPAPREELAPLHQRRFPAVRDNDASDAPGTAGAEPV